MTTSYSRRERRLIARVLKLRRRVILRRDSWSLRALEGTSRHERSSSSSPWPSQSKRPTKFATSGYTSRSRGSSSIGRATPTRSRWSRLFTRISAIRSESPVSCGSCRQMSPTSVVGRSMRVVSTRSGVDTSVRHRLTTRNPNEPQARTGSEGGVPGTGRHGSSLDGRGAQPRPRDIGARHPGHGREGRGELLVRRRPLRESPGTSTGPHFGAPAKSTDFHRTHSGPRETPATFDVHPLHPLQRVGRQPVTGTGSRSRCE